MIENLTIERFKSIRSLSVDCSKVNVLIGPPDTGKTNVLEALYFLSRLGWNWPLDSSLRLRQELGFDPLFYRQFFDSPIRIRLASPPPTGTLDVQARLVGSGRSLEIETGRASIRLGFGDRAHLPDLDVIRFYSYTQSDHWQYESSFPRGTEVINPPHGYNLLYITRHDSRVYELLKELTAPWRLRFDQGQKTFRLSEIREDEILDYNLDLLSDSLKRFFFYASLILTSQEAVLAFDEPDVYAFPPYPKRLGEMIAADASNQFFLTTHNPYLLSSLVEKTPREQLAVFVASRGDDGATALTRLNADQVSEVVEQGASVFFNLDAFVHP